MGRAYAKVMQNRKELEEMLISSLTENHNLFSYGQIKEGMFLPVNASTKSVYKGVNAIRLMQAAVQRGLTDNRWLTFNQVKQLGFKVKAGSTGVLCEHWNFDEESNQNGVPIVSYYYLFNATDIDGLEPISNEKYPEGYEAVVNGELGKIGENVDLLQINIVNLLVKARYGMVTKETVDPKEQDVVSLRQKIKDTKNYVPRMIKIAQEESEKLSLRIDEALLELSAYEGVVVHEDIPHDEAEDESEEEISEESEVIDVDSVLEEISEMPEHLAESKTKIEDFGEKIGGARKDLWAGRGLDVDDLLTMNSAEKEKYITKDNIWKKPDYSKLIEEGLPVKVAYFIKTVRDKVRTHPAISADSDEQKKLQEEFILFVKDLRDCIMQLKTREDVQSFCKTFLYDRGYIGRDGYYGVKVYGKAPNCIDNKLFKAIQMTNFTWDYTYEREIKKKQFGISEENRLPSGYEIKIFQDKFGVCKGRQILETGFQTWDEAKQWIQENKKVANKKTKFIPPQLEHIRREERPDVRKGQNITGEKYLSVFGFYGGEFGNWMNEGDRQASLNMGYEAFHDLADALNISYKDISLNGTLAIAFGARGHGNAVAHYEPMRKVINLTKMNGAGSLAHEWGHALDDYLGNALGYGKMLSEIKAVEFKPVMDAIKYRPATQEEQQLGKTRVASEFYLNSKSIDECTAKCDKGYWSSDCEMFARAFACYVKDKLAPGKSDYLCGHAHACVTAITNKKGELRIVKAYPEGEERERINTEIDSFLRNMKARMLLSDRKEIMKRKMAKKL